MLLFAAYTLTAQTQPPRSQFQTKVLLSKLTDPTQFAFLPDGRIYLLTKDGTIRLADLKTGQLTTAAKLPASNVREDGLHSLVLDPNYAVNRYVYALYGMSTPKTRIVVARFTAQGSGVIDTASRKELLSVDYIMGSNEEHNTGCLAFGPDGNLYVALADNTRNIFSGTGTGFAPRDPRRPEYDAQRSAANSNDLRGKILRIHPEEDGTYTVPAGNLFAKDKAKTRPEIFAMGLRHPFRITVDAKTGWLFWAEPGPNATQDDDNIGVRGYEEINLAKDAGYYGWPYCLANNFCNKEFDYAAAKGGATYDPAHLVNKSANNTGIDTLPAARPALVWYPYNSNGTAFPVFGSGSANTAMLGPVYHFDAGNASTTKLPAFFDGRLFIFDFSRSLIHTVKLDADGKVVSVDRFWDLTTSNPVQNPIDLKVGPDGALYFLGWGDNGHYPNNLGNGNLVRLDYIGPADPILNLPTKRPNSDWSLLAPGATWTPGTGLIRAEAFDLHGRRVWAWQNGTNGTRPEPRLQLLKVWQEKRDRR